MTKRKQESKIRQRALYRVWFNMLYGCNQAATDQMMSDIICDEVASRRRW